MSAATLLGLGGEPVGAAAPVPRDILLRPLAVRSLALAEARDNNEWRIEASIHRSSAGPAILEAAPHDGRGRPLTGLTIHVDLSHPTDEALDHVVPMEEVAPGFYRGKTRADPGRWHLMIDLERGSDRVFHSRSQITLP